MIDKWKKERKRGEIGGREKEAAWHVGAGMASTECPV